jgi:hypothetical protein
MSSQTTFFKIEFPVEMSGRKIRSSDLQSDHIGTFLPCLGNRGREQSSPQAEPAMLGMNSYVEDVAFVGHQPPTQEAIGRCRAVPTRNGDRQAGKGEGKLAAKSTQAPWCREGELLDLDDSKKVAR